MNWMDLPVLHCKTELIKPQYRHFFFVLQCCSVPFTHDCAVKCGASLVIKKPDIAAVILYMNNIAH